MLKTRIFKSLTTSKFQVEIPRDSNYKRTLTVPLHGAMLERQSICIQVRPSQYIPLSQPYQILLDIKLVFTADDTIGPVARTDGYLCQAALPLNTSLNNEIESREYT